MKRLTKYINGYAHGAEGINEEKLTGNYCRGEFEATACIEKLCEYEDLEETNFLLKIPQIRKGKTLYWLWGNEIMPVIFKRIGSLVIDKNGKFHIRCIMTTKKDRELVYTYRNRTYTQTIKAGNIRYFYADDIGKNIFLDKEKAQAALIEKKNMEAIEDAKKA